MVKFGIEKYISQQEVLVKYSKFVKEKINIPINSR